MDDRDASLTTRGNESCAVGSLSMTARPVTFPITCRNLRADSMTLAVTSPAAKSA